jgi:hypothetical protein
MEGHIIDRLCDVFKRRAFTYSNPIVDLHISTSSDCRKATPPRQS